MQLVHTALARVEDLVLFRVHQPSAARTKQLMLLNLGSKPVLVHPGVLVLNFRPYPALATAESATVLRPGEAYDPFPFDTLDVRHSDDFAKGEFVDALMASGPFELRTPIALGGRDTVLTVKVGGLHRIFHNPDHPEFEVEEGSATEEETRPH